MVHGKLGFLGSSAGKESTCNAGDPSSIPGSGSSAGEGIGYPLQHSWASLVTQVVKNPPAMQETWVWSLGWEDLLEEGMATHSSILAWRIPWTEEPGRLESMGLQTVRHDWATKHSTAHGKLWTPLYEKYVQRKLIILARCAVKEISFLWRISFLSK